jgi:hypothetical protein
VRHPRVPVVVAIVTLAAAGLTPAAARPIPGTDCRVFPASNAWHLDVSNLSVHPRSDVWKRSMHARGTLLHPDFGPPSYGMPFDVVDAGHPDVEIRFTYDDESDPGPYPFGASTPIEGGSDRHALMIDRSDCTLYELFAARWNDGDPTAGSGAVFPLEGPGANRLRPAGWTSADAAGLPVFAGLLRYDEVAAGEIDHAIRVTASCTSAKYMWPARHQAATGGWRCPPMGARFRLKAGFSFAGFSADARTILRAMQTHGLVVADNGSDWYFQGTRDPRWTNDLLDELKSVPAKAFQAVDPQACRVARNSARFAYGPGCAAPA